MATYTITYPEFMDLMNENIITSKYQKQFIKKMEKDVIDNDIYGGDGIPKTRIRVKQCETGKHRHSYWITFYYKNPVKKGQLEDVTTLHTSKTIWCKGVENMEEPEDWWQNEFCRQLNLRHHLRHPP